jgi:hypothetical protein
VVASVRCVGYNAVIPVAFVCVSHMTSRKMPSPGGRPARYGASCFAYPAMAAATQPS